MTISSFELRDSTTALSAPVLAFPKNRQSDSNSNIGEIHQKEAQQDIQMHM